LAIVTVSIYNRVGGFGFVSLDDNFYVTDNGRVQSGLSWNNVGWAFTAMEAYNWHPVTWLSHMVDVQIFGVRAGPHHWVNVLFHLINAILLFLVLRSATGAEGPSALVALLFAVHPAHVESVAWISERKDVLSTFFWLLATGAYVGYAKRPSVLRYLAVLPPFALGLMAKPMLVTLPFTLLLLDYWPLSRFRKAGKSAGGLAPWKLFIEKVPLLALSAASSLLTIQAQSAGQSISSLESLSLAVRIETAVISYVRYIGLTLLPTDLSVHYPHPWQSWPTWQFATAGALLAAISVGVLLARRSRPYLAVGWVFYLVTLLPVIGIVQVGSQAIADRYTYVPLTGIFIAAVWTAADFCERRTIPKPLAFAVAAGIVIPLALVARMQAGYWKDSLTLFEHAFKVSPRSDVVQYGFGLALAKTGRHAEALEHEMEALRHRPNDAILCYNIGNELAELGRPDEALTFYQKSLGLKAEDKLRKSIHNDVANTLSQLGRLEEALVHYDAALAIAPGDAKVITNKGNALVLLKRPSEAIELFRKAAVLDRNHTALFINMGIALIELKRYDEARDSFLEAIRQNPSSMSAHRYLAVTYMRMGMLFEARAELERLLALDPNNAQARAAIEGITAALEKSPNPKRANNPT
jgi:tetratricopeptide (TPR) repeat protein